MNNDVSSDSNSPAITTRRKRRLIVLFLILLAHTLGALSAIDAVMKTRTSQGAIAWAVSLVSFPYVAVPAYWVFGRSQFEGYAEASQENHTAITSLLDRIRPEMEAEFVQPNKGIPEYDAIQKLSQLGITGFNRTELLINGKATFDSILEGISKAQEYILMEFYIVRDDDIGRRIRDALIERANNGVRVYFVYDELGSKDLSEEYIEGLRSAGIAMNPFNTTRGIRNRFQLNFRNHRKIMVVDGVSAWVGGLNIGDDYLGHDPELSPWRDTHMRVDGAAAVQVQAVFLSDWYWATRQLIDLNWRAAPATDGQGQVMIIASGPHQERETATLFFTHAINSARQRLWITSPYFVPDEGIISALQLAVLRGVDVRVIIPGTSDSLLMKKAANYYVEELADSGIKFYEYQDGFLHQKVMLIDNEIATVSTANFDNRSFRLNFEITALVHDVEFAKEVKVMIENDLRKSKLVDTKALKESSYWQHIPRRVARLFAPIL